jgi:hypothetical protein
VAIATRQTTSSPTKFYGASNRVDGAAALTDIPSQIGPSQIGPCQSGCLGRWVTVRCPRYLAPIMARAGGMWDPGARHWCIEPRRIGQVIRALKQQTDPLFGQAGIDLDEPSIHDAINPDHREGGT